MTFFKLAFIWAVVVNVCSAFNWQGNWASGCDFHTGCDMASAQVAANQCGPKCQSTNGCTHFSWTDHNGGTCWLKSGGASKSNAHAAASGSAICGVVERNTGGGAGGGLDEGVEKSFTSFRFTLKNKCAQNLWVGAFDQRGHHPNAGGWQLAPNQSTALDLRADFIGRFWARTGCRHENGQFLCDTGDCGPRVQCAGTTGVPPASLAEFTLSGAEGLTFYDVSLLDGTNVPLAITPVRGTYQQGQADCKEVNCHRNLNAVCPNEFKKVVRGQVVGCRSACEKYGSPMYCCAGEFNCSPHGAACPDGLKPCNPATWPVNHAKFFKDNCPNAYSYAYDDVTSTFTCRGNPFTNFVITFCP